MNPPPYDGIGTFLVFLIGIPALVIQFMPPEVRALIMKRWRHMLRFALLAGGWIVLALFVSTIGIVGQLNCVPSVTEKYICPLFFDRGWIWEAWLWPLVFVLLSSITIAASITVITQFGRRTKLVDGWRGQAVRHLNKDGRLDPKALHDLIDLGRASDGGLEKDIVLQALFQITERVYHSKHYEGDSLEILLEGLADVVVTDPHLGNSRNFETVMDILQSVVAEVPIGANGPPPDLLHAVGGLSTIGQVAVRHLNAQVAAKPIVSGYIISLSLAAERHPRISTSVSEALRDLGIIAIETGQMFLALKAFEKLEIRIESQSEHSVHGEVVHDTLALLAHFWTTGPTARGYVNKQIVEILPYLDSGRHDALLAAQQHAARTSHFQTADRIGEMAAQMEENT